MAGTNETIDAFTEAFTDDILVHDLAERLTCTEVEALADVFRLRGKDQAADFWIETHSLGDEEGDLHWLPEKGARVVVTEEIPTRLVGSDTVVTVSAGAIGTVEAAHREIFHVNLRLDSGSLVWVTPDLLTEVR